MLVARRALTTATKMSTVPAPPLASSRVGFLQMPFQLGNQFDEDPIMTTVIKRLCPPEHYQAVSSDLRRLSDASLGEYKTYGDNAEANPPRIEHFDAFGHRIDQLITPEGWRKLHDVSAVEGLVATAYERKYGAFSRIYQFAKLILWTPTTATYGCPLAMTDGAARLIELMDDKELKRDVLPRLITRDPKQFWTSGQWMTERPGGSDVGRTETQATQRPDGTWSITGFKWFSSATDSNITLLLARTRDKNDHVVEGSKGVSLFFAKVRDDNGHLNGIRIQRLKNKLGTKALPTAELELDNMTAKLVGKEGRGVSTIATILNITRIWTGVTCTAGMRRVVNIARDYATRREVFGQSLANQSLHVATLANLEVETRAAELFTFDVAHLLGKSETDVASSDELALLRLLTPLLKLYTGKQATAVISESIEALGGIGYIEDTGVPRILRDMFVNSIWEGTTNILSLDVLRVFSGSAAPLDLLAKRTHQLLDQGASANVDQQPVKESLKKISDYIGKTTSLSRESVEAGARQLAFALARTYCAALLIEHAAFTKNEGDLIAARRWVANLQPPALGLAMCDDNTRQQDCLLVFGRARL